ncbi:hypothetical protein [Methylocapsa aurea]|uniref:hypothetical protein n=1 Tax=Methylocapsa aurea TaxID=663610 RepID=UPI00068CE989|nr:hypothetical protein [Methylocapsa aurea]
MNLGLIISSIALGISLTASAIKLVDWLIGADPRVVIRMGRSLLFVLAIGSLPCLIILLIYQQWTMAMALGAGMLIVPTLFNWRAILPRPTFRPNWTEDDPLDGLRGDFGQPPPGPELAHRAAIVLEDYLMHIGHPGTHARIGHQRPVSQETPTPSRQDRAMSAEEALEILGIKPGAAPTAIQAAHRRLQQLVHPDRGGTNYLAAQIDRAKKTLLAEAAREPHASMRNGASAAAMRAAEDE